MIQRIRALALIPMLTDAKVTRRFILAIDRPVLDRLRDSARAGELDVVAV